jgi:hypothetical protein
MISIPSYLFIQILIISELFYIINILSELKDHILKYLDILYPFNIFCCNLMIYIFQMRTATFYYEL